MGTGPRRGNLLGEAIAPGAAERFETLLERPGARVERIVSAGHATPPGEWYDQEGEEWVALLSGRATLRFAGEEPLELAAGDWLLIPAHARHRDGFDLELTRGLSRKGRVLEVLTDLDAERETVISVGGLASSCWNFIDSVEHTLAELADEIKTHNRRERNRFLGNR